MARQVVYLFEEAAERPREEIGGKGFGLAQMVALGLPVPPGFIVSTTVARGFMQEGRFPNRSRGQMARGIQALERATGKGFGNPENPLLVSVRSGAATSMPGMMQTVLNVGLNDQTVKGLVRQFGERFAYDSWRRFLAMFGETVFGIEQEAFERVLTPIQQDEGVGEEQDLSASALMRVCEAYHAVIEKRAGRAVPCHPQEQLELALGAVFDSWGSERAALYRGARDIPSWWGTATTVQAMVFGNRGNRSCTGVVFSHNTATGNEGLFGEFLVNAQGEDVVAGTRTPQPISAMQEWSPVLYDELAHHVAMLADHYGDIVDVEFTVEEGVLSILQVREAKRASQAAATFAVQGVWAKKWSREDAVGRVSHDQVEQLGRAQFDADALQEAVRERLLARGLPASSGASVGRVAFSSERAREMKDAGDSVVLLRHDTSPDDFDGMLASSAIVTATGGVTCHAAVVANELGLPSVVGVGELPHVREGELISVDGTAGVVVAGTVPVVEVIHPKEVNIFLRWVERFGLDARRLNFSWSEKPLSANRALNDFYLTSVMAREAAGNAFAREARILCDRVHHEIAEQFACYLAIAVAGELRYATGQEDEKIKQALERLDLLFQLEILQNSPRSDAQRRGMRVLAEVERADQAEFFRLATFIFRHGKWNGSVGGEAWARIAEAPLQYLAGEFTPTMFVDRVFDLRHNGGRLFDKHPMFDGETNESTLPLQLDAKKRAPNIETLRRLLLPFSPYSPEVENLWRRGVEAGLWKEEQIGR